MNAQNAAIISKHVWSALDMPHIAMHVDANNWSEFIFWLQFATNNVEETSIKMRKKNLFIETYEEGLV